MSQAHTTGKVLAGTVGAVGLLLATGQAANAASVTVKQNDTVWSLAQQHGVSIKSVEKLNAKALNGNSNLIFVGQKLQINGESSSSAEKGTYTVKAGDTLWDLADKYQTSVQALQKLNGLSSDLIVVGQSLQVSGTKAATTPTKSATTSAAATTEHAASAASSSTTSASTEVQDSVSTTSSSTSSATSASSVASTDSVSASNESSTTDESSTTLKTAYVPAASSTTQSSSTVSSQATSDSSTQVSSAASQSSTSTASQANTNTVASQSSSSTASQSNSSAATSSTTSAATSSASQASSTATNNNSSSTSTNNNANLNSGSVTGLALQLAQANIPYVWGGSTLSGMDCSGLVAYVYLHAAGISLPHNTVAQEAHVSTHSVSAAQPGDILFWGAKGATYHDAIYLGNNQFVAAPTEGQNVKVQSITSDFMPSFAGTVK